MNLTVDYCRDYFEQCQNSDIVQLCDAIDDKTNGLGIIWEMTDFESIFLQLDKHPDNWFIGQARDYLKAKLAELEHTE